jgi:hypothetical protein
MSDENLPIEQQLVRDGLMFEEFQILDTKITPTVGNEDWHVRIELQLDEELVRSGAFGFIYFMGLLSFHDGRPRGVSGKWFEDDDLFTAADTGEHCRSPRVSRSNLARTGAADQVDKAPRSGPKRKGRANDNPKIPRENRYARSDSNRRPVASKARY